MPASEFLSVVRSRRGIKRYLPKDVEEEKLQKILEAVSHAPSARNQQPFRFLIVKDKTLKENISKISFHNDQKILEAPILVVAICNPSLAWKYPNEKDDTALIDVAIALDHLSLSAAALGLGTCWMAKFEEEKLKELVGAKKEERIPIMMTLGYAAEIPEEKPRKKIEELFTKI